MPSSALVVYEQEDRSWKQCCALLVEPLVSDPPPAQWTQALHTLLGLSSPDLPFGRSWRDRLGNFSSLEAREECLDLYSQAILHAVRELAKQLGVASPPAAWAVLACTAVLDSTQPLYYYRPSALTYSTSYSHGNEGFDELHQRALELFLVETEHLHVLVRGFNSDLGNCARLVKLATQIASEYDPTHRPKFLLVHLQELVSACCTTGLEAAGPFANKKTAQELVRELIRLGSGAGGVPLPVASWKQMAMHWYRSEKLTLKRQALEQLGLICRFLVLETKLDKEQVTLFLKQDQVLDGIFSDSMEDERLMLGLEDVLANVQVDEEMIGMFVKRGGSLAIQRLLGNIACQFTFGEDTSVMLLSYATKEMLLRRDPGAFALMHAALVESKTARNALLRKGKLCANAVVSALLVVLLVEGQDLAIDALYQTLQEYDAKHLKKFAIDYLTVCGFNLPTKHEGDDNQTLVRTSQGGSKLAALKALRRLLSSYTLVHTSTYSSNSSSSGYHFENTRGEVLGKLEREFWFSEALLGLEVDSADELRAKLDLLGFVKRFSTSRPQYGLHMNELQLVYAQSHERFLPLLCEWLCTCVSIGTNPCMDKETMEFALLELFSKRELLVTGGEELYKLMQLLFCRVNANRHHLLCEQEHDVGSRQFKQSHPPQALRGQQLVGSMVSVLHQDGAMQHGLITGFKEWGRHQFDYYSGVVEEKAIEELNEWWLLPREIRAGKVKFPEQQGLVQDDLLGLEQIWQLALESEMDSVALRASHLLFSLYACNGNTEQFVNSVFTHLAVLTGERDIARSLDLLENLGSLGGVSSEQQVVLFDILARNDDDYSLALKLRIWELLRVAKQARVVSPSSPSSLLASSFWLDLYMVDYAKHSRTRVLAMLHDHPTLAPYVASSIDFPSLREDDDEGQDDANRLVALLVQLAACMRLEELASDKFLQPSLQIIQLLTTLPFAIDLNLVWEMLVTHPSGTVRVAFQRLIAPRMDKLMQPVLLQGLARLEGSLVDVPECGEFFDLLCQQQPPLALEFSPLLHLVLTKREPTILLGLIQLLTLLLGLPMQTVTAQDARAYTRQLLDVFVLQPNTYPHSVKERIAQVVVQLRHPDLVLSELDSCLEQFYPYIASEDVEQPRNPESRVGLFNRGSTCYLNSVLQLLYSVEPFRRQILAAQLSPPAPAPPAAAAALTSSEEASTPPLPATSPPMVLGWRCWCSGVNDIACQACEICGTFRLPDCELILADSVSNSPSSFGDYSLPGVDGTTPTTTTTATAATGPSASPVVEVLRQVQRAFSYLELSQSSAFDPVLLVQASKCLNLLYPVTSQNDAGEFYDKVLDAIEQAFKLEGLAYEDCFSGQSCTLKKCLHCHHTSKTQLDTFSRLELMVRNESELKQSLRECLDAFAQPEVLSGDNKVDCDVCKLRSETTFTHCVSRLPPYLFILPKRFTYDLERNATVKLDHYISFEAEINLQSLTEEYITHGSGGEDVVYDLTGILIHKGKAGGGHYYSFVKGAGDKWQQCNDDRVSAFDFDRKLAQECFGGTVERTTVNEWNYTHTKTVDVDKNAFMLLYSKRAAQTTGAAVRKRKLHEVVDGFALKSEVDAANQLAFCRRMLASPAIIDLYLACVVAAGTASPPKALDFYFKVVCHHADLAQCDKWLGEVRLGEYALDVKQISQVVYDVHLQRHKRVATLLGVVRVATPDQVRAIYDEYARLNSAAAGSLSKQRGLFECFVLVGGKLCDLLAPPPPPSLELLDNPSLELVHDFLSAFAPAMAGNVRLQIVLLELVSVSPLVSTYLEKGFESGGGEGLDEFLDKLLLSALMECHTGASALGFEPTAKVQLLRRMCRTPEHVDKALTAVSETLFSSGMTGAALRLGPYKLPGLPAHAVWEEKLFPANQSELRFAVRMVVGVFAPLAATVTGNAKWDELCKWFLLVSSPLNQLAHSNGMLDEDVVAKTRTALLVGGAVSREAALAVSEWCGNSLQDLAFSVERAGDPTCNGLYEVKPPMVLDSTRWYCEANGLSLYKCALSTGADEWFISRLLPGVSHSDPKTIDYYSCSVVAASLSPTTTATSLVPHPAEWLSRGKQGAYPAPLVRKVVLNSFVEHQGQASSEGDYDDLEERGSII